MVRGLSSTQNVPLLFLGEDDALAPPLPPPLPISHDTVSSSCNEHALSIFDNLPTPGEFVTRALKEKTITVLHDSYPHTIEIEESENMLSIYHGNLPIPESFMNSVGEQLSKKNLFCIFLPAKKTQIYYSDEEFDYSEDEIYCFDDENSMKDDETLPATFSSSAMEDD